jgi:hypothetical protein
MVRLYARGGGGVAPRLHNLTFWFTVLHSETECSRIVVGAARPAPLSPAPPLRKSHISRPVPANHAGIRAQPAPEV